MPRAPRSRQPPAVSLELVSEVTSRVSHLCRLPSPQTRPGMSLETVVGREKSFCGLRLCVATDFAGYVITFKIIGALCECF